MHFHKIFLFAVLTGAICGSFASESQNTIDEYRDFTAVNYEYAAKEHYEQKLLDSGVKQEKIKEVLNGFAIAATECHIDALVEVLDENDDIPMTFEEFAQQMVEFPDPGNGSWMLILSASYEECITSAAEEAGLPEQ